MAYDSDRFRALGSGLHSFLEGFFDVDAVEARPAAAAAATDDNVLEKVWVDPGGREARIERRLNHPVRAVWESLTKPEKLAEWLGRTDVELQAGAEFHLHFDNTGADVFGTVTKYDPPHVLEFLWKTQEEPDEVPPAVHVATGNGSCIQDLRSTRVQWVLRPTVNGTMLSLTHTLATAAREQLESPADDVDIPVVLASWQNHFDGLTSSLRGELETPGQPEFPWNRWEILRDKYGQMIG